MKSVWFKKFGKISFLLMFIIVIVKCTPKDSNELIDKTEFKPEDQVNYESQDEGISYSDYQKLLYLIKFLRHLENTNIKSHDLFRYMKINSEDDFVRDRRGRPNEFNIKKLLNSKRDCHLGLGMGYLCHAYSITRFAQHQKLMSDPKGPGRR